MLVDGPASVALRCLSLISTASKMATRLLWPYEACRRMLCLGASAVILTACGNDKPAQLPAAPASAPAPAPAFVPAFAPAAVAAPEPRLLGVSVVENGDLTEGLPVRYESFDAPQLLDLREREHLDEVVASAQDEFEQVLLLKNWVAAQWPHSIPDPYPPWNALVVLDWIRSGKTGGFCAQYSQVLLQSLASLGLTARYVEIGSVSNPYAHYVIEVWSNQFDKWMVMDGDYNIHFERNGVPLSALEVHDALLHSQLSDIVVVRGSFRDGHPDPGSWPDGTMELYYYLRMHLKANHLSAPDEPPFDRYNDMVEWQDELTVPWELSTVESPFPKEVLANLRSSDGASFESKLNQVRITLESVTEGEALLDFENNAIQFQRYQIREPSGDSSRWSDYDGTTFQWKLSPSSPLLEVRALNGRGVPGPTSVVLARFSTYIPPPI